MKKIIEYEMEMAEEKIVKMSLNFADILWLRNEDDQLYKKTNKVIVKGIDEMPEIISVLYAAYKCANKNEGNLMTYQFFTENMNTDINYNLDVIKELIGSSGKKPQTSSKYF